MSINTDKIDNLDYIGVFAIQANINLDNWIVVCLRTSLNIYKNQWTSDWKKYKENTTDNQSS